MFFCEQTENSAARLSFGWGGKKVFTVTQQSLNAAYIYFGDGSDCGYLWLLFRSLGDLKFKQFFFSPLPAGNLVWLS